MAEEIVSEVVLNLARHANNGLPHQEPENSLDQGDPDQKSGVL